MVIKSRDGAIYAHLSARRPQNLKIVTAKVGLMKQWITGGILAATVGIGIAAAQSTRPLREVAPDQKTTIVHLFEWRWNDVAQECERYLGPAGFKAVQVSPPQEHIVAAEAGYPWWQRYQPVSYQLESRSGDRQEFADMVSRCRQAGVDIYVDAVINHMAGYLDGIGSGGARFTKYDYPGLYDVADFNRCRQPVKDYQNADEVTQCELVGLADLNTSSPKVQTQLVNYLTLLTQLGVTGFRIDAAKHIRAAELGEILQQLRGRVGNDIFVYQEVIDPGNEAIKKQDYYTHGAVVDFEYGRKVGEAFLGIDSKTLADLEGLEDSKHLAPSKQAVIFIDNHDKQRGHGGGGNYLTHKDAQLYTLANIFMLAFPYGQARVMSSYAFTDSEQGPPSLVEGQTMPVYTLEGDRCFAEWVCEHRWTPISGMVAFRNYAAANNTVTDWWSNGSNQLAFGRGDRAYVAINREPTPLTQTFITQLPPGAYCDAITGGLAATADTCLGKTITVNAQGRFTATVASMEAIALHRAARLPK